MAGALAFRTLFGMLPVFVVATVLIRAMGMEQWFLEPLDKFFQIAGLDEITVIPPSDVTGPVQTLSVWLMERVVQAEKLDMAALGWAGLIVTIYAAISLLVTIENSFNTIYRAPTGRSWTRRVPLYWFILTLSPLAVILSTYMNNLFENWVGSFESWQWVPVALSMLWSLLVVWLFIFIVYVLFPNTKVTLRPALSGAFAAALLLELGKGTMGAYLQRALTISQLYGSLGLVPLFMFWVYLMWLVILFWIGGRRHFTIAARPAVGGAGSAPSAGEHRGAFARVGTHGSRRRKIPARRGDDGTGIGGRAVVSAGHDLPSHRETRRRGVSTPTGRWGPCGEPRQTAGPGNG